MSTDNDMPKLIRLERKQKSMLLNWSNEFQYELSYQTLLYWCPCAKCSPSRDNESTASEKRATIDKILFDKPQVSKVGSYALKFEFPQGCNSGIFSFERLYKLCKDDNPDEGKPYVHGAW
jgi:DUF971 family protein